jgi:hypothetical protein
MSKDLQSQYDALYQEYQDVMYKGAWRLGWSFFFVLVGLLPMMYIFIWLAGPRTWEHTFFHAPKIMWIAAPLNLGIVVFLLSRLYQRNLALDVIKQGYLTRLHALKIQLPNVPKLILNPVPERDWDSFQDDPLA